MKWLLTTDLIVTKEDLRPWVEDCSDPIPLGDDEQVFEVDGNASLPERLKGQTHVLSVCPSSELSLY